jgi:uroporphyrinogen decarboxylase
MFDTYLGSCTALFQKIWDAGYRFDEISWPDDMGYKGTTFFSPAMYRELLKPFHKRAVDWAHEKGIYAHLHSCGNIMTLVPDLMEIGLDALNPLEVKAGMDPYFLKDTYGDKLVLWGGCSALNWEEKGAVMEDVETLVPYMKQGGGYIFATDHSVPDSVDMEEFRAVMERVKELGRY